MELDQQQINQMLQMSPWDFDQSPNGWRKIADGSLEEKPQDRLKAASLISEFILQNKDKILTPKAGDQEIKIEIMYFHIGQLLALTGPEYYQQALEAFNQAFYLNRPTAWNEYVLATIGFLEGDQTKIGQSIIKIESFPKDQRGAGNLGIVKNFQQALKSGIRDYIKVYRMPKNDS